ncbi:MAG: family 78 glycoside hydrolase catalytic domain [Firmicutes bacterium]|nr:family 78 glycoside hydrolase catalytic domain [Bacillota bacterium]
MKITSLKTNHLVNPLGYTLGTPRISYIVEETTAKKQTAARVTVALDEAMSQVVHDSGKRADIDSTAYVLSMELAPRTRYYWQVQVWADNGDEATSDVAWFETCKGAEWVGQWITPDLDPSIHPVLFKELPLEKKVARARAYMVGLGVYEWSINGKKVGDEYLMPGIHAYDSWIQYQTYDITEYLSDNNTIEVVLGNGWYKGDYGLTSKHDVYGDKFVLLADIYVEYEDGTCDIFGTDTTWQARKNFVTYSDIYNGEHIDMTLDCSEVVGVKIEDKSYDSLMPRLSPALTIHERLKPVEVIRTPKNEIVLDMGQNMVGWMEFTVNAPAGTKIRLQHGEILQDDCFYTENLRTAKQEFIYTCQEGENQARSYFTFYGFRYVLVEGWPGQVDPEAFTGCVIYSDMEETGRIETSNPLVNRLFENTRWGQKGNFLDTATDCPQRDERMGWTGDAQIFCGTASYNMDTYAFYTKYSHDLAQEQNKLGGGNVPYVVPMAGYAGDGSCAWGEAATVIPWEVYLHFGDKAILEDQYESMKGWVEYMHTADEVSGANRLWTVGCHFADWLALDGKIEGGVYGGTDPYFIASAYYYYSTNIVAKAAAVLGKAEDAAYYGKLAAEIKAAIGEEYFTKKGRLAIDTQTAHTLVLFMDLAPEGMKERMKKDLRRLLKDNYFHLNTGFVGTPYLCRALSDNGMNDVAYTLLLNDDFPSWLYEVKMGATTVWERWNSVMPDGYISGTGMNSLNHYAYGAVVEWMYRNMIGIRPVEEAPGFRKVVIQPQPDYRIEWAKLDLRSAVGSYHVSWKMGPAMEGGLRQMTVKVSVPFGAEATVILPDAETVECDVQGLTFVQDGANVKVVVDAGSYEFTYITTKAYTKIYSVECTLPELLANPKAHAALMKHLPIFRPESEEEVPWVDDKSNIEELLKSPFLRTKEAVIEALDADLRMITD